MAEEWRGYDRTEGAASLGPDPSRNLGGGAKQGNGFMKQGSLGKSRAV